MLASSLGFLYLEFSPTEQVSHALQAKNTTVQEALSSQTYFLACLFPLVSFQIEDSFDTLMQLIKRNSFNCVHTTSSRSNDGLLG